MTTTEQSSTRQITVKEAIASVVGYLSRQSGNLAIGYVTTGVTEDALDDLRAGLSVIVGGIDEIVRAMRQGETHLAAFAEEL